MRGFLADKVNLVRAAALRSVAEHLLVLRGLGMKANGWRRILSCVTLIITCWSTLISAQIVNQSSKLNTREENAVRTLRTVASAEGLYLSERGRFGELSELIEAGYLGADYADGSVQEGYRLTQVAVDARAELYEFTSEPLGADVGRYAFNVIDDHVIRFAKGATAPVGSAGKVLGADPLD